MTSYTYNKLSPEEKEALLSQRKELHVPLHSPPHQWRDAGIYLISAANYYHQPVMSSISRRSGFEERLLRGFDVHVKINGWEILPNHYHILINVPDLNTVSTALRALHGLTAREWNLEDGLTGKRKVWYKFFDQRIRDEKHYWQALNYIHSNPLKHQYADSVYDWPWSSLSLYYEAEGKEWLRKKWKDYPTGDMGKGWDE